MCQCEPPLKTPLRKGCGLIENSRVRALLTTRSSHPSRWLILAGVGLGGFGLSCQDYLFEQQCPAEIKEANETFQPADPTPADILFIVDNSGSMADEQQNLADNFNRFIENIQGAGDYRIAVVSTDQDNQIERGGLARFDYSGDSPFHLTDFDLTTNCVDTGISRGCFRGPDPAVRVIEAGMPEQQQITAFVNNVDLGSCGSGNETGLSAMISALEQTQGNGCNGGFIRDEANLVLIFVSDENDADNEQIQQYVNDLARIKGDFSKIRVAAIVGSLDGQASDCSINEGASCGLTVCNNPPPQGSGNACTANGNNCPAGEFCSQGNCQNEELRYFTPTQCGSCSFYNSPDCCSAQAGSRYINFARAVEARIVAEDPSVEALNCSGEGRRIGCLIDTICQDNFGATLERIARDLVIVDEFALNPPAANPEGVAIQIRNKATDEVRRLVNGQDFEVTVQNGVGVSVRITGDLPTSDEEVELFFVLENEPRAEPLVGACATSTSP